MSGLPKHKVGFSTRDIYRSCCGQIAEALGKDGFHYQKSKAILQRESVKGDLVFQIAFQSSHLNNSGKLIALWIHCHVFSPTLKTWRTNHACLRKDSDFVAGGQIGNLLELPSWMEWNFADSSTRSDLIINVISTIREIALPFFDQFEKIEALLTGLTKGVPPGFHPADILDILMCYRTQSEVAIAAQKMLEELPGALGRYRTALAQFREEGLPAFTLTNHGEVLAAATLLFGPKLKT